MIRLYDNGVYLINGTEIIEDNGTVIIPGVSLSAKDETTDSVYSYDYKTYDYYDHEFD